MKTLLLALTFALAAGTAHAEPFSAERTYHFNVFGSDEACKKAQQDPDFWMNCYQEVTLSTDGSATVVLTDIMNPGTYTRNGNKVVVSYETDAGGQDTMAFALSRDGQSMALEGTTQVWLLAK
jgi:hypothetical protein